jgi:hypothetical protein
MELTDGFTISQHQPCLMAAAFFGLVCAITSIREWHQDGWRQKEVFLAPCQRTKALARRLVWRC